MFCPDTEVQCRGPSDGSLTVSSDVTGNHPGLLSSGVCAMASTTLFNIWNNYKPRFPDWYYNEKLVKVGDELVEMKEYKLALTQCYGRYLQEICSVNLNKIGSDVHQFKSDFFPKGLRDPTAARTFHVLQVRNICIYKLVCDNDEDLLNQESVKTCFRLLSILQLIMQMTLPHERLCWLVYNGTIHMYTICRHLMTIGQSAKVLEYLLWACVCMESSVPLLAVHYLPWRATLYAAVCQCYYDCYSGINGEIFARRGLVKIDELKQMENMSSPALSTETKRKFKEATVKMAAMIFKRSAFEPRRRPKGLFRPRVKNNMKDIQHLPWPRTISERLMMEIFDCNSSIFFGILEALFDRNRRTLIPSPPIPDEMEIRDVISELFFAGVDILDVLWESYTFCVTLIGKSGISAYAALRFLKMAFSYEEWDSFDHAAIVFFSFLQNQNAPKWKKAESELKILLVMQPLITARKPRHGLCVHGGVIRESSTFRSTGRKSITFQGVSQLVAAQLIITPRSYNVLLPDREMMTDATMFLWQKCKIAILRIQNSGSYFLKSLLKYQTAKWVHILYVINEVIHAINLGDTNTVVMAEVALRLTSVMETIADFTIKCGTTSGIVFMKTLKSPSEQLHLAYEYLDRAINAMNRARLITLLPDGTSVLDNCSYDINEKSVIGNNFIMDLHIELIQAQHRVAVKLLNLPQDYGNTVLCLIYYFTLNNCFTEQDVTNKIKKNKLSRALYLMQKATLMPVGAVSSSPKQLLEEALTLIQKAEAEQNAIRSAFLQPASSAKSKVPPPPILLSRSHNSMAFKPAPFASDVKIAWYCIFGRVAEGCNPKVRLNNYSLKNTAEVVPFDETCILEVEDLEPNQSYIFAVAAYDSDGNLISDSIGETTKPILAYPPLSAAAVRAYLIQSAFQVENYALSKKAFLPLWDYFVFEPHIPDVTVISVSSTLIVPQNRLIPEALSRASPNLLYLFIRSIFIINDITVVEGNLFCDSVCFNDLRYSRQVARIAECGRMLVALELSNWLNDVNYALQSVVHCYGLLAPLIYHRIPSKPVIQIIIKYLTVLQEMSLSTFQKRSTACYESLQHMIACSCYFTVLRSWKEYELAIVVVNYGKRLLDCSQGTSQSAVTAETGDEIIEEEVTAPTFHFLVLDIRLDLTGDEDVLLLYPVVSNWQTKNAHKEVMKFKKSPRFLEYFVKLVYKAITEERFSRILEWTDDVLDYLKKRNRFLLGIKRVTKKGKKGRGTVSCIILTHLDLADVIKMREKEESRRVAMQVLTQKLNLRSNVFLKRKRWRRVYVEELPWRSQLNIYLAIAHFNLFKKRIEELYAIDPDEKDTPRPQGLPQGYVTVKEREKAQSYSSLLEHFVKIFLHFRRAAVLAYRGGHWTLLQNVCRDLWTYTQEAQSIIRHSQSFHAPFPITKELFHDTIWLPYYMASDMLLDMVVDLQATDSVKIVEAEGDFCVPSCVGGIAQDEGGSNFSFEYPFDDICVVDLQGVRNLVLRTIELLFFLKKWESLVYIAMQFNTITHERYTEQLIPLVVYAQRQLQERAQVRDFTSAHPKFKYLVTDTGRKVKYADQGRALVSVPLDVSDALQCFSESLEKAKYHSRSIKYSRKLLALFLAHTQEALQKNDQQDLMVQAFSELGNIHFYTGNKRAAFKCWCQGLDGVLKIVDALNHWHELDGLSENATGNLANSSQGYCEKFVSRGGIWGCLQGAILAAKIAQYILLYDVKLRTKACILSAILFKSLFRVSLPHPKADCDFAQYETDVLIPGIDLFTDYYRADVATVVGSLTYVIYELHCNKQNLIVSSHKGILLAEAEERINSVLEIIQNKYGTLLYECSASELETVIEAKLQLAAIAQQRLQTAFSAALAFSAIKLLQDATIFKKSLDSIKKPERKIEINGDIIYVEDSNLLHNVTARKHMNIHIWLRCRLALVTAMTAQARGIETMKENELKECSSLIGEVQMEAEEFNDVETLAEITMQAVMLGLQEGKPVADIKCCLQNVIRLLEEKTLISPPASLTLVQSMLLLTDIMKTQAGEDSDNHTSKTDQMDVLIMAHTILYILGQLLEKPTADPTLITLLEPLKNIYLPHIRLLAKVKLRIAHTLTLELSCMSKPQSEFQWVKALRHTETALDLCAASVRREFDLEAELLFRKGNMQLISPQYSYTCVVYIVHRVEIVMNYLLVTAVPKAGAGLFAKEDVLFTSVFDTTVTLRLAELHSFLKIYLLIYSGCCLQEPPKQLYGFEKPCYSMTVLGKVISLLPKRQTSWKLPASLACSSEMDIHSDNKATSTPIRELCVQWYLPSLERSLKEGETMVRLQNWYFLVYSMFVLSLLQIPFDITLPSIKNLRKLFEPANGCVIIAGNVFNWIVSLLA
uniref:Cilia and flagella associated protein 54 n=1 Tax=Podarcis muralis TaxID=64176 RepID=A0A670IXX3_PODMU